MRIVLFALDQQAYSIRMMVEFGWALHENDHDITVGGKDERNLLHVDCDVVIDINQARPEWLPKHIVHIAWVQDIKPGQVPEYEARAQANDLVYSMGDAGVLGLGTGRHYCGSLLTGVFPALLSMPPPEPEIDFSICGYIPPPMLPFEGREFALERLIIKKVAEDFKPLTGTWHPLECMELCRKLVYRFANDVGYPHLAAIKWRDDHFRKVVGILAREMVRQIEREKLVELALSVSDSLELHGYNWEQFPQCAPYYKGTQSLADELWQVYRRTRINLHSNMMGFALHSRVLEAMAVGGFVMAHVSKYGTKAGQMQESFEPGVHYGEFDMDNFGERAKFWLGYPDQRWRIVQQSRRVVAARHLWTHRAQQVLKDLGLRRSIFSGERLLVV